MRTWLQELIQPGADRAVDKMIHRTRPDYFHEWVPPGSCPYCPVVKNALARTMARRPDLAARLAKISEALDEG